MDQQFISLDLQRMLSGGWGLFHQEKSRSHLNKKKAEGTYAERMLEIKELAIEFNVCLA